MALTPYTISVWTGSVNESGSNGDVWVKFRRRDGNEVTGWIFLDDPAVDDFENGMVDTYYIELPAFGPPASVSVAFRPRGGNPSWFLKKITIALGHGTPSDPATAWGSFVFNQWYRNETTRPGPDSPYRPTRFQHRRWTDEELLESKAPFVTVDAESELPPPESTTQNPGESPKEGAITEATSAPFDFFSPRIAVTSLRLWRAYSYRGNQWSNLAEFQNRQIRDFGTIDVGSHGLVIGSTTRGGTFWLLGFGTNEMRVNRGTGSAFMMTFDMVTPQGFTGFMWYMDGGSHLESGACARTLRVAMANLTTRTVYFNQSASFTGEIARVPQSWLQDPPAQAVNPGDNVRVAVLISCIGAEEAQADTWFNISPSFHP